MKQIIKRVKMIKVISAFYLFYGLLTISSCFATDTNHYDHLKPQAPQIEKKSETPHCEIESNALINFSIDQYEIAFIEANNRILKWFITYNEKENVSSKDQAWSYKTYTMSTYILARKANKSLRVRLLLDKLSSNTADFLNNKQTFEVFYKNNLSIGKEIDLIRQSILLRNQNAISSVQNETKNLADCAHATGMMAATYEPK